MSLRRVHLKCPPEYISNWIHNCKRWEGMMRIQHREKTGYNVWTLVYSSIWLVINSPILHMMAIQDSSKWKDVMQYLDLAILFLQFAGMQMHTLASQYGFRSRPIRKQFKVFTGFGVFHKFLGFLEFHRFRGFVSLVSQRSAVSQMQRSCLWLNLVHTLQ